MGSDLSKVIMQLPDPSQVQRLCCISTEKQRALGPSCGDHACKLVPTSIVPGALSLRPASLGCPRNPEGVPALYRERGSIGHAVEQ